MLVIYNAKIRTFHPDEPIASAIAIDRGKVIAIGSDDEILSIDAPSQSINAGGRTVIPGLTDAHIHLEEYAFSLQKVDCETTSIEECLDRVAARVRSARPGDWILGHGWNQNNWSAGYGNAAQLDSVAPHNPVYLTHKSLHSGWANTLGMQLAGITPSTLDPSDGRIGRLPNGDLDGILFESAALLVERAIPQPTLEQVIEAIQAAVPRLWQVGITGIHDFDLPRCFSALQVLHQAGDLKLRVLKGIHLEDLAHAIEVGLRSGFGDDMLRVGPLKLFSDGALGPHTAAMLAPYNGDPSNSGLLMMDAEAVFQHGRQAVENGISLAVHAIGDRANREVLQGFARLREYEQHLPGEYRKPLRHRIEHVQVIAPADIHLFNVLQIIASMQPIHATSDMLMAERGWGGRSAYAYAWRSLLSHGSRMIFGSDAPVESPNPFLGLHAAVTRRRVDGSPSPQGWYPEQCLTVDEALRAFTTGPAYAAGMEEKLGRLSPGFLADLLVLDRDPYSSRAQDLWNIHPVVTIVGGELVFSQLEE